MFYIKPSLPSLIDIEDFVAEQDATNNPMLRVAVLRNVTMESIEPYLRYLSLKMEFQVEIDFGGFDNIVQETIGDSSSILHDELDTVLVFTPLASLSSLLDIKFASLTQTQIEEEITYILELVSAIAKGIREKTNAMLLWHGLEAPIYPALGIQDTQSQLGQTAIVGQINNSLQDILSTVGNAYFVNMEACLARVGANQFYDIRYWNLARAPYSRQGLAEIANEDFKYIRAQKGLTSKCLVLDCDNTLWGGIIGEDGLEGIKLSQNHPGSAFLDFQNEVLSLYKRGIILALCSKNNEQDVWEVFDKHPDMLIKREHIAAWKINWQDKASNLRELALELNIGIDSIVFADDSDFEVNLIKEQIPEIKVLPLPKNRPAEYRWLLAASGYFDSPFLTNEDLNRGTLYHDENKRREIRESTTDLDSYCRSLKMQIEIGYADELTIPRIAQQTQKTNQFNLTTKRYTESDIANYSQSTEYDVLWLKVSDKFGDMGIVGSCIVHYKDSTAIIDTFLLSCRALGRGIEKRFLTEMINIISRKDVGFIHGQYIPSQKNIQVAEFLLNFEFDLLATDDNESEWYEYNLANKPIVVPDYFDDVRTPLK